MAAPFDITKLAPQLTGDAQKIIKQVGGYLVKARSVKSVSVPPGKASELLADLNRVLSQQRKPAINTKTFIYKGVEIKERA